MQSKAASMRVSSMCTFSLDWMSRDFLLAKTCRWLETWQKTGWRKGKEKKMGCDYRGKGEFIQWAPTLMLLWYSRTLLRARTWMWLDTYRARVTPFRENTHSQNYLATSYDVKWWKVNIACKHQWRFGAQQKQTVHSVNIRQLNGEQSHN